MTYNDWQNKGNYINILSHNIFVIDKGKSNTTLAILHGYPTSSLDFYKVIDELSNKYRVIIHDHLGFGFSDKPLQDSYSLKTQADIAERLWQKCNVKDIIILAHNYGTSVATELLARNNEKNLKVNLRGLILCNGSIHIELAKLRNIQKLLKSNTFGPLVAKIANKFTFKRNMKNIFYNKSKLTNKEIKNMWFLLKNNNGKPVLPQITKYIDERYTYWDRWVGALKQTDLMVGLVWATKDPVAVKAIAKQLDSEIKNSRLFWLKKTGHYPMLENPELWTSLVFQALKTMETSL